MGNRLRLKKNSKNHRIINKTIYIIIYMENLVKTCKNLEINENHREIDENHGETDENHGETDENIENWRKTIEKWRLTGKIGAKQLDSKNGRSALIRVDPR